MVTILEAAIEYAEAGHRVLPIWGVRMDGSCECPEAGGCTNKGKHPHGRLVPNGLKDATDEELVIRSWWQQAPTCNVGLCTGHEFFVIDCDKLEEWDGTALFVKMMAERGVSLSTATAVTGGGGTHFCFGYDSEIVAVRNQQAMMVSGRRVTGIDVRGEGGYIVAPPSVHESGKTYEWRVDLSLCRAADPQLIEIVASTARTVLGGDWTSGPRTGQGFLLGREVAEEEKKRLAAALEVIPPNTDRTTWIERVSMPLHDTFGGSQEGFNMWHGWCQKGRGLVTPNGNEAYGGLPECLRIWRSFSVKHRNPKGSATLYQLAQTHGWKPSGNGQADGTGTQIDGFLGLQAAGPIMFDPEELAASLDGPKDPGPFPASVFANLRGPLADTMDWITAASRRPDPVISLATTLGIISGSLGRRVIGPESTRPTMAIALLAPSGAGKDRPQECLKNVLHGHPNVHVALFDDTPTHRTQLDEKLLKHSGQLLMVLDEYGAALRRWLSGSDVAANSMSPTIRRLATHGMTTYHLSPVSSRHPSRAADPTAWDSGIFAPSFTLVGFATPGQFYESLSESSLIDGFLGRHIVIVSRSTADLRAPKASTVDWPESLSDWLRSVEAIPVPRVSPPTVSDALAIPDGAPARADVAPKDPIDIPWASGTVEEAWIGMVRDIDAAAHKANDAADEALTAILRRLPGQVMVLALVIACGEAAEVDLAQIGERHLDTAFRIAQWSADNLTYKLRYGIPQDDFGRAYGRLCEMIEAKGSRRTYRSVESRKLWLAPYLNRAWGLVAGDPRYVATDKWAHIRGPEDNDSD